MCPPYPCLYGRTGYCYHGSHKGHLLRCSPDFNHYASRKTPDGFSEDLRMSTQETAERIPQKLAPPTKNTRYTTCVHFPRWGRIGHAGGNLLPIHLRSSFGRGTRDSRKKRPEEQIDWRDSNAQPSFHTIINNRRRS